MSGDTKVEVPVTLRLAPEVAEWLGALARQHGYTTDAEASLIIYNARLSFGAVEAFRARRSGGAR